MILHDTSETHHPGGDALDLTESGDPVVWHIHPPVGDIPGLAHGHSLSGHLDGVVTEPYEPFPTT